MQWTDDAIVLGIRRHGEASAIAELFTREHGRHLGLVRGGFGSRLKPVLQPGNGVRAVWRARLDEHLGTYTVEPVKTRTASMFASAHALFGVTHLASLARLLPERDPHARGLRRSRSDPRPARRHARHRAAGRPLRNADVVRARFRARSCILRGDRGDGRAHLRLAKVRTRGVARRRRGDGPTNCSGCRHFFRTATSRRRRRM